MVPTGQILFFVRLMTSRKIILTNQIIALLVKTTFMLIEKMMNVFKKLVIVVMICKFQENAD